MSTIGAGSLVGIVLCVSVFKCMHTPLKWMKSMQKVKQQCHSCLAWSEVRWMAGAAPESCFSHTVSASVSTAIHLLCLSASPCPLPPQALLTEAMDTGSCSCSEEIRLLESQGILFFNARELRDRKKGALDKSSCYCHFLLVKPCSTQLNTQRCFIGAHVIQRPLLD